MRMIWMSLGLVACAGLPTYRANLVDRYLRVPQREVETALDEHRMLRIEAVKWPEDVLLSKGDQGEWLGVGITCTHLGCQVRPDEYK